MRRERKAEVELERDRGGERLMEKGRGRDGVGEHARAKDSVYLLFILYPNLAGREISASCPSGTSDWSCGRANPPPLLNDHHPGNPEIIFPAVSPNVWSRDLGMTRYRNRGRGMDVQELVRITVCCGDAR